MKPTITIIIPARNEAEVLGRTLKELHVALAERTHQIIVVNDHSKDVTEIVARRGLCDSDRVIANHSHPGYGHAVRAALPYIAGERVVVMVADGSDDPRDLVAMLEHPGIVFGSRWRNGGSVTGYPWLKRIANRVGNTLARWALRVPYDDLTNPFKVYPASIFRQYARASKATDFSLGFEIAVRYVRDRRFFSPNSPVAVVSHTWVEREAGTSKFKVKHVIGYARTFMRVWMS